MKKLLRVITFAFLVCALTNSLNAQVSMGNGSYSTGYGQVYGSLNYAMSVQNSYQAIQNLLRSNARTANRKSGTANNTSTSSDSSKITAPPTPKYYGRFRPDPSVNMTKTISELSETPEAREQMKAVVETVQKIYKDEAAKRGWGNNLAGGMTFFMVTMSMVYHDTDQPGDKSITAIYDAVNQSIDADPKFAEASNADKQKVNDTLVGLSALPFLTFIEGKRESNANTIQTAQQLAGAMIKAVFKAEPETFKFDDKSLAINK